MAEYIEKSEIYRRYFNNRCGVVRLHVSDIDVIPAADVAPVVHGRWIKVKPVHYQCSICGVNTGGFTSNYCPNCGAKMDKDKEEF